MFGINRLWLYGAAVLAVMALALMIRSAGYNDGFRKGVTHERTTWQPVLQNFKTCKANLATTEAALDRSQAAVDSITADGEDRSQRAASAILQARKASETYRKERQRITSARAGDDQCSAARALIVETLEARR